MQVHQKASDINMLSGSLWISILKYSIPLMFSQVLQTLFNMADVAVVGKFADALAVGSVGSTSSLISLFTGLLLGLSAGVNVRTACFIGARDKKGVCETVHTSFLLCLLGGFILTLLSLLFSKDFLILLHTKEDLLEGALLYIRIFSLGMPAIGVFHFGNAVLSASGDTKRPLLYLSVAGVLNVILNLIFVIVFHMGAVGVALASTISQYVSATLIFVYIIRLDSDCRLCFKKLRFYKGRTWEILSLGIPAGLQYSIFSLANLFVQSGVNSFSSIIVSGNTIAANIDSVIANIIGAFGTACSSFIGQNWGAGNKDRMLKSYFVALTYSVFICAFLGFVLLVFGNEILSLFANSKDIIAAGMNRLKILGWAYGLSAVMDITIDASRGMGESLAPTLLVIMGSCVFRVIWIYTVFAYFGTASSLYMLYPISWFITSAAEIIYFIQSFKKLNI